MNPGGTSPANDPIMLVHLSETAGPNDVTAITRIPISKLRTRLLLAAGVGMMVAVDLLLLVRVLVGS